MIQSLFETLEDLGWTLQWVQRLKPNIQISAEERQVLERRSKELDRKLENSRLEDEERLRLLADIKTVAGRLISIEKVTPGSLDLVLESSQNQEDSQTPIHCAAAAFHKDRRWLEMQVESSKPGLLRIGSDESYFGSADSTSDLKRLFSKLPLTEGTIVRGDIESLIETPSKRTWIFKRTFSRLAFFWIDMLSSSQWDTIRKSFPDLEENELTSVGKKHVVMMSDSPYIPIPEHVRKLCG